MEPTVQSKSNVIEYARCIYIKYGYKILQAYHRGARAPLCSCWIRVCSVKKYDKRRRRQSRFVTMWIATQIGRHFENCQTNGSYAMTNQNSNALPSPHQKQILHRLFPNRAAVLLELAFQKCFKRKWGRAILLRQVQGVSNIWICWYHRLAENLKNIMWCSNV